MADNKSDFIDDNPTGKGIEPKQTSTAAEALDPSNEERSLDIGESGQFAPGGYYNQRGVTKPDRLDLDEQVSSGLSDDSQK
ncbi:MAG: hypothetical protein ICV68_05565 [Pyrinomonadaceae bacterium]|nr:hypothetical protein [Pyrinomonadaceae bacterium]